MNTEPTVLSQLTHELADHTIASVEAQQRLANAIEAEYQKAQPDLALIEACEDLLLALHGQQADALNIPLDRYDAAVKKAVQKKRFRFFSPLKVSLAAAALLVLLLLPTSFRWTTGCTSEGGEIYRVTPHEFSLLPIDRSDANVHEEGIFTFDTFEALEAHLGYSPNLPSPESLNADSVEYTFDNNHSIKSLFARYGFSDKDAIHFSIHEFFPGVPAQLDLQQNEQGEYVHYQGRELYFYQNMHRNGCLWSEELTVYTLQGFTNAEQAFSIINDLIKE